MRTWQILRALVPALWAPRPDRGPRLRQAFQQLGGVWPKVGQLLSLRFDLFPADICEALAGLQTEATSAGIVASIGVVHRGVLADGTAVAIKDVQRGKAEEIAADLRAVWLVGRCLPLRRLRLREALAELRVILQEETDLRYEGTRQRAMRKCLRSHGIHVPKVYALDRDQLVSRWVDGLTMTEFLALPQADRAAWCEANDLPEPKRIARRLMLSLLRQIFEDNRFHGDLHPGNILLAPGRIVLIDFGTVGSTEGDFLARFSAFVKALATRHYMRAAHLFCYLCRGLTSHGLMRMLATNRLERLRRRLVTVMERWAAKTEIKDLPYHEKSINACTQALMTEVLKAKGSMEWAWLRLQRALSTLDAVMASLWPGVNYLKLARAYLAKAEQRIKKQPANPYAIANQLRYILDRTAEYVTIETTNGLLDGMLKGL